MLRKDSVEGIFKSVYEILALDSSRKIIALSLSVSSGATHSDITKEPISQRRKTELSNSPFGRLTITIQPAGNVTDKRKWVSAVGSFFTETRKRCSHALMFASTLWLAVLDRKRGSFCEAVYT